MEAKQRLEASAPTPRSLMDTLPALGPVRARLLSRLASGLRADAPDAARAARQRWRQAEMQALDYGFVLLSRFVAAAPSPEELAAGGDGGWALPIGAVVLGLRQVGLSAGPGVARECAALEQELMAWQRAGGLTQRDAALRLKASLQRVRRLTQAFSQLVLGTLAPVAAQLGAALGVPEHVGAVFAEAEIRASVVFQLSRLVAGMVKGADTVLGGESPFDVIVAGKAVGALRLVDSLEDGAAVARLLDESDEVCDCVGGGGRLDDILSRSVHARPAIRLGTLIQLVSPHHPSSPAEHSRRKVGLGRRGGGGLWQETERHHPPARHPPPLAPGGQGTPGTSALCPRRGPGRV